MSPRASQDVLQDTLKAPVYLVFRGFFVSGRPVTVLAIQGFLLILSVARGGAVLVFQLPTWVNMALTDVAIKSSKPRESAFKLLDGRSLQLQITPQGSRLWSWTYRYEGKQKLMALGVYPDVFLAQARDEAHLARKLLATGVDSMATRKSDKIARRVAVEDTFAAEATKWWESWEAARSDSQTPLRVAPAGS